MNKKILYLGPKEALSSLNVLFEKYDNFSLIACNEININDEIIDAYGIIDASMKVIFDEKLILKAKNLKIISCATTGSDHISRSICKRNEIAIRTLREDSDLLLNLTPAAELSWTLLLACARNLKGAVNHVLKGNWNREQFPGVMLNGKTIGIIGCGRIGNWMSKYAKAFGMEVLGYDPYIDYFPQTIIKVDIEELFKKSDFITIHVHLSSETEGLVNKRLLEMAKPNVIIINTSRGKIINEQALLDALNNKKIAAVGLDVLEDEPNIKESKLYEYAQQNDNIIITPHCGGYSIQAVEKVCLRAAEKIINKEIG
jgi:phosphoglycerate dehydrogenase-like enzyme